MATSFWRNRRVFVTGHTGFKGAWLSLILARLGADVYGFSRDPRPYSIYEAAKVSKHLKRSTISDVRDLSSVRSAIAEADPEIVFHLAAQPLVRCSYEEPVETFEVNVIGTCHILEAIRKRPSVRAALMITSDKCYENREWIWGYRENEPMGGHDPYSASKGCSELVTSAYRRSFFIQGETRIASARAGNVIGGGDTSRDRLIPDLVRNFREGRKALIRNPSAVRPWQHVLEPVSGYIMLAEKLCSDEGMSYAEGWNFGPGMAAERSVREVVDAACKSWGGDASWLHDEREHVHEANFLKLDSSKANRFLNWNSRWDFETAIDTTLQWYRAQDNDEDMSTYTGLQIESYFSN